MIFDLIGVDQDGFKKDGFDVHASDREGFDTEGFFGKKGWIDIEDKVKQSKRKNAWN